MSKPSIALGGMALAAVALCACNGNLPALKTAQTALQAELTTHLEMAHRLEQRNSELSELEMRLHQAIVRLPNEQISEITQLKAEPAPAPVQPPERARISVPEKGFFESADCTKVRALITQLENQLRGTDQLIGRLGLVAQREADLRLQTIEAERRASAAPAK